MPPLWAIQEAERARQRAERAENSIIEMAQQQQQHAAKAAEAAIAAAAAAERSKAERAAAAAAAPETSQQQRAAKRPREVGPAWAEWESGEAALEEAKRRGRWPDGARLGKGHVRPYLQPPYARSIRDGSKTVEGRPRSGWAAKVQAGDYVTFNISSSGGQKLACRVTRVRTFDSFAAMLESCGLQACLPGVTGGVAEGVRLYRSFGSSAGSYADLETSVGVVGIDVEPLGGDASDRGAGGERSESDGGGGEGEALGDLLEGW